jgi:hypothetical protein
MKQHRIRRRKRKMDIRYKVGEKVKVRGPSATLTPAQKLSRQWFYLMYSLKGHIMTVKEVVPRKDGTYYKLDGGTPSMLFYQPFLEDLDDWEDEGPTNPLSKEELKKLNMEPDRKKCAKCGGPLAGWVDFKYCPKCEVE